MAATTPRATASNGLSILECTAADLAAYLWKERFNRSMPDACDFLKACSQHLQSIASIEEARTEDDDETEWGERLALPGNDDNDNDTVEASFVSPRAKMTTTLWQNGLQAMTAKGEPLRILADNVEQIIIFSKPEDCRKHMALTGKNGRGNKSNTSATQQQQQQMLVLISLQDPVSFKKKKLDQVCLQLPTSYSVGLLQEAFHLSTKQIGRIGPGAPYQFRSHDGGVTSTTSSGMPFVRCYLGVHDGVLFPMKEGLLFFK